MAPARRTRPRWRSRGPLHGPVRLFPVNPKLPGSCRCHRTKPPSGFCAIARKQAVWPRPVGPEPVQTPALGNRVFETTSPQRSNPGAGGTVNVHGSPPAGCSARPRGPEPSFVGLPGERTRAEILARPCPAVAKEKARRHAPRPPETIPSRAPSSAPFDPRAFWARPSSSPSGRNGHRCRKA